MICLYCKGYSTLHHPTATTKRCNSIGAAISIAFCVSSRQFDPMTQAESGLMAQHNVIPHVQVAADSKRALAGHGRPRRPIADLTIFSWAQPIHACSWQMWHHFKREISKLSNSIWCIATKHWEIMNLIPSSLLFVLCLQCTAAQSCCSAHLIHIPCHCLLSHTAVRRLSSWSLWLSEMWPASCEAEEEITAHTW